MSIPVQSPALFERQIVVTVGPKGGVGKQITGLRIVFHIEKNLEKAPNPSTIEITNLSSDTISWIQSIPVDLNGPNGPVIIVQAGYSNVPPANLPTIFRGDIAKLTVKKTGTDTVATIESGDGQFSYLNARQEVSFKAGSTFGQVLDTITGFFGSVTKGTQLGINRADTFLSGISLTGPIRNSLDTLLKRQGLIWSVQDGALQILPADGTTGVSAVLLSPKTGLIGSPFRTKVIRPDLTNQTSQLQISGMKFLSLLNDRLRPGAPVQVNSEFVQGVFRIEKVTHMGDTHGQPWYSEIEAR